MNKKEISKLMASYGKKGGKKRALALSKRRRCEIAQMGGLKKAKNKLKKL